MTIDADFCYAGCNLCCMLFTLRLASELIMLRVISLNVIKVGVIEITFHCSQNFDDPIMFAPRKRASRHLSG